MIMAVVIVIINGYGCSFGNGYKYLFDIVSIMVMAMATIIGTFIYIVMDIVKEILVATVVLMVA